MRLLLLALISLLMACGGHRIEYEYKERPTDGKLYYDTYNDHFNCKSKKVYEKVITKIRRCLEADRDKLIRMSYGSQFKYQGMGDAGELPYLLLRIDSCIHRASKLCQRAYKYYVKLGNYFGDSKPCAGATGDAKKACDNYWDDRLTNKH